MERNCTSHSFVTEDRMAEAVRRADEFAEVDPLLAAHDCAAAAVRSVFGEWLAQPDGALRAEYLPFYFQLCNRVESRLGLHRDARLAVRGVVSAARAGRPGYSAMAPDSFVGATAIAI